MEWNVPPQSDGEFLAEQIGDAPHHFAGGLVGEREQQDAVGGNALFEQIGDAVGERARLARTGAGDDERRAGRRGDGGELLRIEFARVINLQMDCGTERFEDVIARHGAELKGQTGEGKRKNIRWSARFLDCSAATIFVKCALITRLESRSYLDLMRADA